LSQSSSFFESFGSFNSNDSHKDAEESSEDIKVIELTRLNGHHLTVNCDLIKHAEAAPDTVLTLVTGEKLVVLESCDEVALRTLDYRARILKAAWPEAAAMLSAKAAYDANHFSKIIKAEAE
jgi:flagellar protein FlbD